MSGWHTGGADMTNDTAAASRVRVLRASSEDLAAETWHQAFTEAVGQGVVHVALDLSRVTSLGPLQLARLLQLTRRLRESGGDLRLFGLQPRARLLLTTVVPEGTVSLHDTEAEAVRMPTA